MTVIFSNAGDEDCQTLRNLWKDIPDVKVVEFDRAYNTNEHIWEELDDAIDNEKEFLILCGHGTPYGLLAPDFQCEVFDEYDVPYVNAKKVLCIWCNANEFCKKYDFKCLSSSMYISNPSEAYMNGIDGITQDEINETNNKTFSEINELIKTNVPLNEWKENLLSTLDENNEVDSFNRNGFIMFD